MDHRENDMMMNCRCLLTWIIRKQAESAEEGEPLVLLVDEDDATVLAAAAANATSTTARQENNHQPPQEPQQQQQPQQRRDVPQNLLNQRELWASLARSAAGQERHQRSLLKCPQCGTPYHIRMGQHEWWGTALMQSFEFAESVTDYLVPYTAFIGSSYVVVISSITYGVYAVTTICGPWDPLSQSIRSGMSWNHQALFSLIALHIRCLDVEVLVGTVLGAVCSATDSHACCGGSFVVG